MASTDQGGKSRAGLFIENMLVYGLGSMLAKLVPFVMLPVVTRLMPGTTYFGLSDLSNTLVSFMQAFAIMGMYDAMFRLFFENDDERYKRSICSTALFFVTGASLIIGLAMLLFEDPIARIFFGGSEYASLVVISALSTVVGSNNSIIQAPTRMQNQRIRFVVMNLVTAVLSYSISIPLILAGQYLLALPLAAALSSLTSLIVFYVMNRHWFSIKLWDRQRLIEMLKIGVPLMPSFLFYWIFNSADRLMIVNYLGTDASGIYATAAKLGQVSQLIYTAFAQGWQYFAFSTMKDDDQVELNSRVYEYLGIVSFLATGLLLVFLVPIYNLMFPPQYASGVYSVAYLFLSPLLLMLYQVATNQLLVIKKTWPAIFILSAGAITNVALNMALIPTIGIEGASVATLVGYIVTNVVSLAVLERIKLLAIKPRFSFAAGAFLIVFLCWRFLLFGQIIPLLIVWILYLAPISRLYHDDVRSLLAKLNRGKDGAE